MCYSEVKDSLWSNSMSVKDEVHMITEVVICNGMQTDKCEPHWLSWYGMYDFPRIPWLSWWSHQMETFSGLLAICAGNSPVPGEFPTQSPVTRSFDVFFDLLLNTRLSKQPWGLWFEAPPRSLWRHCNVTRGLQLCSHTCFRQICPLIPRNCCPIWRQDDRQERGKHEIRVRILISSPVHPSITTRIPIHAGKQTYLSNASWTVVQQIPAR